RPFERDATDADVAIEYVQVETAAQFDRVATEFDFRDTARKVAAEMRPAQCGGQLRHLDTDDRKRTGVAFAARRTWQQAELFKAYLTAKHVDREGFGQHDRSPT